MIKSKILSKTSKMLFEGVSRRIVLTFFDFICFCLIDFLYYQINNLVGSSNIVSGLNYLQHSIIIFVCIFVCRFSFKVYNNIWRYTSTSAYLRLVISDATGSLMAIIIINSVVFLLKTGINIEIWHTVTVAALSNLLALASRFVYRILYKYYNQHNKKSIKDTPRVRAAIVGAGQLGAHLASQLLSNSNSRYKPMCFIDNNKTKIGQTICGLPVYSNKDAKSVIEEYRLTDIIVSIENISSEKMESLWTRYNSLGCKVKIYDTPVFENNDNKNNKKRVVREFQIEDLLFRRPLDINKKADFGYYADKTVLVTGGGGSIGSELCRQLIKCKPKKLIIFDIYENNAYDIQQELIRKYSDEINLSVEIGSVRDVERLECIFENYRPDIVFHAAAHKHVPLMEHSGAEAVKNNVLGTYNTANMAEKFGVEKFILVSTDKAVNPTNIMGASKRLCEMIIQCRVDSKTNFAAVRFGNVLGSNGSVIPLFKRQIAAGGPLTLTDRRIIRYFMTIPEASQLVIQAGSKANKGELFVLDMGQPVRIYDLAVNMIKLMGYEPGKDIEIIETGLRPGEKLYEELLMKNETLEKTDNDMIFIEKDKAYSRTEVDEKIDILRKAVEDSKHKTDSAIVKAAFRRTVPTFIDPEDVNKNADNAEEMKMSKKLYSTV